MKIMTIIFLFSLFSCQCSLGMEKKEESNSDIRSKIMLEKYNDGGISTMKDSELYLKDFESEEGLSKINQRGFADINMNIKTFSEILKQVRNEDRLVTILGSGMACVFGCLLGPALAGIK